ncbi:AAA family ATPase [Candidatus Micrarchaeota archaeon]|nr:AAA family ATPase [Candidatus Micrarchaeota archaeon]
MRYPSMVNYFEESGEETPIIKDENILLPDYVPDGLLHRNAELQGIADAIKPILRKGIPDNLFIHGPSGSGKTSCIRHIMKQLGSYSAAVLPVYVNCWENPTQMAVYNRIIEEMRLPLPRRGLATDEIFARIREYVRNYRKPVLLVLDELDGLRSDKLLYVVSRANEKQLMFGIVGITNNKLLLSKLDSRVRSSLRFSEMEFKEYKEEQLLAILEMRAEKALAPGSYSEKLLTKIARLVENGSARTAIERLWKAAKHAEKSGKQKIMIQHLEDVIQEQPAFKLPEYNLTAEELLIMEILEQGELRSSGLYERFTKKIPKTKRQIRNYLDLLENKGLIESEELEAEGMLRPKVFRRR